MKRIIWTYPALFFVTLIALMGCRTPEKKPIPGTNAIIVVTNGLSMIEVSMLSQGLVDISAYDPSIKVALAYSTTNNFLGRDVYADMEKCYLLSGAAVMLTNAQAILKKNHPGYSLVVYDGARPVSVQEAMWKLVKDTPQKIYVADPAKGSIHNYGGAVDLSVAGPDGIPLDMGTPFDSFSDLSQPKYEEQFLKDKLLSYTQYSNRLILREAMLGAGFKGIPNEWWHFNAYPKDELKKKYQTIK
ncbi:MAG: M15 family metallopeptidase [Brevinematales bacterium]|nr:M15 family metallopeptidase [Brevinematales bacterium]